MNNEVNNSFQSQNRNYNNNEPINNEMYSYNNQQNFNYNSQSNNINAELNNNYNQNNNTLQYETNNQQHNFQNKNSQNVNKNNKNKIIGIVVAVVVVLVVGIMLFSGGNSSSSGNGYTVDYGETLKVNELEGYYNFEMEVLSVEKNYLIDEVFHSGECLAMKVKIKNNSDEDLSISPIMMKFNLLDSSNNEISSLNISMSSTMTNALEEIPSGQEAMGYFYFFDVNEDGITSNIKNNNIAKLEVEVMKHIENKDGVISGDYEQYYVNLK